ncbi:hypothetical protein Tco_0341160 [Tanacetum coccineum]
MRDITQGIVLSDKSDTWDWSLNVSSGFSVASVRTLVDSHILDASPVPTRWNRSIPIKINVFLWRLSLNKLATRVNLDRKGMWIRPYALYAWRMLKPLTTFSFLVIWRRYCGVCLLLGGSLIFRFVPMLRTGSGGLIPCIARIGLSR